MNDTTLIFINIKNTRPSVAFSDTVLSTWFFSPKLLKFGFFLVLLGVRICLASVSPDDVRYVINVSSTEVPDAKVLKMIKRGGYA